MHVLLGLLLLAVAEVAMGASGGYVVATGVVVPARAVDIAAKPMGRIVSLHVERGDRVEADAVLLQLDTAELLADRAAAEAELAAAQVESDWRARAADRLERLARAESLSEDRLDEARYGLAAAEQRVKLADAKLAKIEALLADRRLLAPFGGIIVARTAELGQLTQPGAPLLRLEDHSRLELHARVKELDLPSIQVDAPVKVRIDALGSDWLQGRVEAVIPSGDSDHTFLVEITLPTREGLYPGMFGKVRFVQ
ncbi:MAG: efflux RND transporter periplasmic adaptor subunit [Thiohalocapsa sp. PB-PSB1]|jgi:RND family efflux transporter MFP subunit|nr:MAG: efflux RND transporter periplasmic adaptor subunit [Thiohalocapsa sp. PB-PSB1]